MYNIHIIGFAEGIHGILLNRSFNKHQDKRVLTRNSKDIFDDRAIKSRITLNEDLSNDRERKGA